METTRQVSVWPILHYDDTEAALRFLVDIIGFEEGLVARDDNGGIAHCELRWPEGGTVLFGSASHTDSVHGAMRPGTAAMYVPTTHVADIHARADAAAATITMPPAHTTFGSGDQAYAFTLQDTEGYLWTFGDYDGAHH